MFSETANHFRGETNPLYRERDALLRMGGNLIDLVSGNVHLHGIHYPGPTLERALRDASDLARLYTPHPLGQPVAREAVSRHYREAGLSLPLEQIVMTPGTSFSYWYVFKLFADPGDEILCPTPTYPLFDSIAALAGVHLTYYRLDESIGWRIDLKDLESKITPKTRGIVLISPHNPTGAVATEEEIERIAAIASRQGLPIISDEVFAPFLFQDKEFPRPAKSAAPLVMTLNGFSKMLALPGMKIGWIGITGEPSLVKEAINALEMISDTFLPVNEIAQFAAPALLREGESFLAFYRTEIRKRCASAVGFLSKTRRLSFHRPEGGFYLAVRINEAGVDEEAFALGLLRRHRIMVHPGFFYDLPPPHFVISFVSDQAVLESALDKLIGSLS